MRVRDFEEAIKAMGPAIVIDEMKLHSGHVRRCYGHKDAMVLMWDKKGEAYYIEYPYDEPIDHETHEAFPDNTYNRCIDNNLDLF